MKTRLLTALGAIALITGCATDSDGIRIVRDFDEPPRPISTPAPKYPFDAMDEGVEGSAQIDFVVTKQGRVSDVAFLNPLDGRLKEAVLEATRKWQFSPALKAGAAVDSRLKTGVEFRRKDGGGSVR